MPQSPNYSIKTSEILTQLRLQRIDQTFCQRYLYIIISTSTLIISTTLFLFVNAIAQCQDGFVKNGLFCYINQCGRNGCNHKGYCNFNTQNRSYYCQCKWPYTGMYCHKCENGYNKYSNVETAAVGYFIDSDFICVKDLEDCSGLRRLHYDGQQLSQQCICQEGQYGPNCDKCEVGYLMHEGKCRKNLCHKTCYGGKAQCMFMDDVFQCICNEGHIGTGCNKCKQGWKMIHGHCIQLY